MVRQVPRKALERCVADGRVKGTALAVDKILTEERAAPRAGLQDSGGPAPAMAAGTVLPPVLVLPAGSMQGIPPLLGIGLIPSLHIAEKS